MPCYRDEIKKTWYCSFYYRDWIGKNRRKFKRGFKTKKEAQEYERKFIENLSLESDMIFKVLFNNYLDDIKYKIKPQTITTKVKVFTLHILPYFENMKINEITSNLILKWHNELLEKNSKINCQKLNPSYIRKIHSEMSAIMNYSVKHYGINKNPCKIAGNVKKQKEKEMQIWTVDEYKKFIQTFKNPQHILMFDILFWTGIRKGELMALTPSDFSSNKILHITKTYYRRNKKDIISTPKTQGSKRDIILPDFLYKEYQEYVSKIYALKDSDRLFTSSDSSINKLFDRHIVTSGVKRIRIHDLRHSHASLLIDMGDFSIIEISKRLGHDKPQTTLNIYGHLYSDKQKQLADKLDDLVK